MMSPTRPTRFLWRIAVFLAAILTLAVIQWPLLRIAFESNPGLNAAILALLLVGIGLVIRQMLRLDAEIRWIEDWTNGLDRPGQIQPRILESLIRLLREAGGQPVRLTGGQLRSILDGIGQRLDDGREASRYLAGLLVFLGLLGTFFGLIATISGIADVINSFTPAGDGDFSTVWSDLQQRLQPPLSGMGTAFSASLFGLAGSLVLGFLDLQLGQAQSRFHLEIEEWLNPLPGTGQQGQADPAHGGGGRIAQPVPARALPDPMSGLVEERALAPTAAYAAPSSPELLAILQETARAIDALRRAHADAEDGRRQLMLAVRDLSVETRGLARNAQGQMQLLTDLGAERDRLAPVLARLATLAEAQRLGEDQPVVGLLRSVDAGLSQLAEAQAEQRERLVQDLGLELRALGRILRAGLDRLPAAAPAAPVPLERDRLEPPARAGE